MGRTFVSSLSSLLGGFIRRRVVRAWVIVLVTALLATAPAHAHLSVIRQGADGAGVLEADDRTGSALAFGDFNGDGIEDLAIGVPHEADGVQLDAGCVIVHYGGEFGPTHRGALLLTAALAGGSTQAAAQFGAALAAGDFDGDGDDDLAVGSPGENVGPNNGAGRVYIFPGGAAGLATAASPIFGQGPVGVVESGDHFGQTLLADDFDSATPPEDLVVGSPGEDSGAGAISVYHGTGSGLSTTTAPFFRESSFGVTGFPGDRFGAALAAGQISGLSSSNRDLAVGAPGRDVGGNADAGRVYVIAGDAGGIGNTAVAYDAPDGGPQTDAEFGFALACGHYSSSALDWIAIGEPGREVGGFAGAGRVVIAPSNGSGPDMTAAVSVYQTSIFAPGTTDDRFGAALASGTWTSDGFDDLAIAAPSASFLSPAASAAGRCFVVPGSSAGLDGSATEIFDESTADWQVQDGATFGTTLAFGACDAGDRASLAVSAPLQDEDPDETDGVAALADAGAVYVIAPWRQPAQAEYHCFAAVDCDDSLVVTRRPFDRTAPSGAARIMTVLLAAESGMGSASYTIPSWVEDDFAGTLPAGESVTVTGLMSKCLVGGAVDAAYAIADFLTDGASLPLDVCAFVTDMNDRAAALGMSGTHFSNPSGVDARPSDCGITYSTAEDMTRLARAAMDNSVFASLSGLTVAYVLFTPPFPGVPHVEKVEDHWLENVQDAMPASDGVHRGFAAGGGCSDVGTVAVSSDRAIAAGFMAERNDPAVVAELMHLAFASCSTAPNLEYHPITPIVPISADSVGVYIPQPDESRALAYLQQTVEVSRALSALRTVRTGPDTSVFRMRRLTGMDTVRVVLSAFEDLEGSMAPQDSIEIAYRASRTASFSSAGLRLENSGSGPASLRLVRSGRPDTTFQVPGGGALRLLPALQVSGLTDYVLLNQGASPARLIWEDLGHSWSVRLGTAQSDTAQFAVTRILHGPLRGSDTSLGARVRGVPGDSVEYGIYPPAALPLLGVDALARTSAPALRIVDVLPNPASGPSRVRFEHPGGGPVEVALFDAAGRRWSSWTVDGLASARHEVRWNGSDSQGTSAPPGVYFWRVRSLQSGASSTVRFVRLR